MIREGLLASEIPVGVGDPPGTLSLLTHPSVQGTGFSAANRVCRKSENWEELFHFTTVKTGNYFLKEKPVLWGIMMPSFQLITIFFLGIGGTRL